MPLAPPPLQTRAPDSDICRVDNGEQQAAAGPERPGSATLAPTLAPIRSRWQKGTLTFGPFGRLAWTFGASLPLLWWIKNVVSNGLLPGDPTALMGQLFGGVFVVIWMGWIWHRVIRDVWANEIVYVPQPMKPPTQMLTNGKGEHIQTMEEYVASQADAESPYLR